MESFNSLIISLSSYLKVYLKIEELPKLKLIKNDSENSEKILGKTAYYDPTNKLVALYTKNRHPKDILRSYAHELVHHKQNEQGRLTKIYTTNIREDKELIKLEEEAYLIGNMLFRNWETIIKNGELNNQ